MRKRNLFPAMAAALAVVLSPTAVGAAHEQDRKGSAVERRVSQKEIERGRYLMTVGSCNDCHTAEFAPRDGQVAEKDWLLGSGPLGFRGPWGTTYAPNLRVTVSKMTEAQWVKYANELKTRPPMPWFNLNQWKEADLKALYQYIRRLPAVGGETRAYVPPDKAPPPPYIQWPVPPKQ
jgi:mono/diheme cytochrome c family protein